jgi:hypothetical protein
MKRFTLMLCALLLIGAPIAEARGKKTDTTPGTYDGWGEADIDEIEIVKTFDTSDYDKIVVVEFNTSNVKPEGDKAVVIQGALDGYTAVFTEGLRDDLESKKKVEIASKTPKSGKTLVIRGKVEDINPGSRAKRYLAGFGAGAAANKISGEILDASTGKVLVRFTQAHRSAGTFKFAGGSDAQVLRDGTRAMGEDVAYILNMF